MKRIALIIAGVLAVFIAARAAAQPSAGSARQRKIDGVRIEAHLALSYYGGFGLGARVEIPLLADGFLSSGSVEDELALTAGGDVLFVDYYDYDYGYYDQHRDDWVGALLGAAQWNFYLSGAWSVFGEGGLVFTWGDFGHHGHFHDRYWGDHTHWYLDPFLGGGARWHFSRRNALVFRLSWPAGLQIGITF